MSNYLPHWLYDYFCSVNMSLSSKRHAKRPAEPLSKGLLTWAHWFLSLTFKCRLHKRKLFPIQWDGSDILTLSEFFNCRQASCLPACAKTFRILILENICLGGELMVKGDGLKKINKNGSGVFSKWQNGSGSIPNSRFMAWASKGTARRFNSVSPLDMRN